MSGSASTQPDPNPNHDGQHAPQSTRNMGSVESGSSCSPLLPSLLLEKTLPTAATEHYTLVNVLSPVSHYGTFFMGHCFTTSPDISLAEWEESDLEELAAILVAGDIDLDVLEDTLVSLLHLADMQSDQLSHKIQSRPSPGDVPTNDSHSNSSVSGPHENPPAVDRKTPAPSFRADLLTDSPSQSADPPVQSVVARKRLPPPLPQTSARTRKPEKQCKPKNIKSKSTCLDDKSLSVKDELRCTVPVPSNTSSVADSYPDSCDSQVDCNSPGLVPDKQILEAPKGMQVSQEFASSGISSKLKTGECGETGRKSQKKEGKDARTGLLEPEPTAVSGREAMIVKTTDKMKEKKEEDEIFGVTNIVKMRRGQRRSGQIEKDKAIKNVKSIKETAENRKLKQKSIKKTEFTAEDGLIYEKQKRLSSGARQLCVRDRSNLQERSQGTETANTVKQSSEMGKNKHQKQAGEMQKLKAEAGEQCVARNTLENVLLIKTREKKDTCERRVKCKDDGIQMSSSVRRRTRSLTKDPTGSRATGNVKHSEMKRSKIMSSPSAEILDKLKINVMENINKHPLSSPIKKGRRNENGESATNANKDLTARKIKVKVSENCRSTSQSESSLQDKDNATKADQGRQKAAPNEINKSKHPTSSLKVPSLKTSKKSLKSSPHPESIQLTHKQSERVERSEAIEGRHKAETWDLQSLRSCTQKQKMSKKVINSKEIHNNKDSQASHRSSSPKPSPSQTAQVTAENEKISEEHTRLTSSPTKRFFQESESSEESETTAHTTEKSGNKTEMLSPSKKAKLKSKQLTPTKLRIKFS